MPRLIRHMAVLAAALFFSGIAAAGTQLPTVSSTESAVTIKATPKTLQDDTWEFQVAFDTHSQELKDDLMKTAVLVTAEGSPVLPIEWKGAPPGGHHREGVLRFNAITPVPTTIELRIQRPGEAKPRSFRWMLK